MRKRAATDGARRTWGPFSGTQLTIILVALIVMTLFPVGAWAVSGSNVFVTDSQSGAHATVNAAGALTVNEASPKTFYANAASEAGDGLDVYTPLATPATGHALVITSVVVNVGKITTPDQSVHVDLAISKGGATCQQVSKLNTFYPLASVTPSNRGATVIPFQPGIPIPAGRSLCTSEGDPANLVATVYAYGYTVPASATTPGV